MSEADASFEIRSDEDRVTVAWHGRWDEPTANDYAKALREHLASHPGGRPHLVVDATELVYCNILARGRLADLHETLRPAIRRCAYVASSARMRGLCLWIVKVAGDTSAKVLANTRDVDAWLESEVSRVEDAKHRITRQLSALGKEVG